MKVLGFILPKIYQYLCPCLHNVVNKWLESGIPDHSIKSRDLFSDLRIAALRESYARAKADLLKAPESIKEAQQMRINQIERVIDNHCERLVMEADGVDPFDIESYEIKLDLLQANEHTLKARSHRTGEQILRMIGRTQSYYMYDSFVYKKAHQMRKLLQQNDEATINDNSQAPLVIEEDPELAAIETIEDKS